MAERRYLEHDEGRIDEMALTDKDFIDRIKWVRKEGEPPLWSALDDHCQEHLRRLAFETVSSVQRKQRSKAVKQLDVEEMLERLSKWSEKDAEGVLIQWIYSGAVTRVQGTEGYVCFWDLDTQHKLAAEYIRDKLGGRDLSALDPKDKKYREFPIDSLVERVDDYPDWQEVINCLIDQVNPTAVIILLRELFVPKDFDPADDIKKYLSKGRKRIGKRRKYLSQITKINSNMRQKLEESWEDWEWRTENELDMQRRVIRGPSLEEKALLKNILLQRFKIDEINDLVWELGEKMSEHLFRGDDKLLANAVIDHFVNRSRLDELIKAVCKKREQLRDEYPDFFSKYT